jgi:amidophosphoribosyltransferase
LENAQPVTVQTYHGEISIAQNGNLTTQRKLKKNLMKNGVGIFRESDVEIIAQILAQNPEGYDISEGAQWEKRITSFMHQSDGAYSLVMIADDKIFACRDYLGMRPLCIGKLHFEKNGKTITRYCVSSESCALHISGAKLEREVKPGELIRIDEDGVHSWQAREPKPALCIFEYVYFARPDSFLQNQLIAKVRERIGAQLADECPCPQADIVVGVPDSSIPAAIGYANKSGIPLSEGIMKNRYVHRTFIQPSQTLRQLGVSMKFTPIEERLKGKKVVLVDDSIVRGNTITNLVTLLRNAGALEIHVRASAPPIRNPCFMGIDMATTQQMVAHGRTVDQICKEIGADSLGYVSHEGLEKSVREGLTEEDRKNSGYCGACFTGKYPIEVDDW